jgi:hypothetical protein
MKFLTATVLLAFAASAIAKSGGGDKEDKRSIGFTSYPRQWIRTVVDAKPDTE